MDYEFIPQDLSITAMRSSGYRNTASALAELIDNSIQAGDAVGGVTQVEVICIDRPSADGTRKKLSQIAVFDNAAGMDVPMLWQSLQFGNGSHLERKNQKGIGKFGMGLPNSSISQCRRVDVWSWQNRKVHTTYLDVGKIENKTLSKVPEPALTVLPSAWLQVIASEMPASGTLVVWDDLDRVTWKRSSTLLTHIEFIIGRTYRHFINAGRVRIRLASYEESNGTFQLGKQRFVSPNDPLYLMRDTSAPAPYNKEPAFDPFPSPNPLQIKFRDEFYPVTIKASICKPEVRQAGGSSDIGKHAGQNIGISIVRAGRELEMNRSFEITDARERWWGIEVEFDPGLDDVFGVTNNKQAATGFLRRNLDEDAEEEGMSPSAYQHMLEADSDPRIAMYVISDEIGRLLRDLRKKVERMKESERVKKQTATVESIAEEAATNSLKKRREQWGDNGLSDQQETESEPDRTGVLTADVETEGIEHSKALEIAVEYIKKGRKFRFKHGPVPSNSIFDIAMVGGVMVITLNTQHPVHAKLFKPLQDEGADSHPYLQDVLFLVASWARMEDETLSEKGRKVMWEIRQKWGSIADDLFENVAD
ncbi:ATP-binding protein [Rhizobium leguminosarum]|uniref:ATP-binding protein n=1 Tax=Rhizobium leguminosarum TaxID=384 RepID=UPI00144244BE